VLAGYVSAGVSVHRLRQVHSAVVLPASQARAEPWPEAHGLVSDGGGQCLWACGADCTPVLIADPGARVVAACHAGWQGALSGIVASTVAQMVALGADPAGMVAAVGPCIGPASYEVGLEFLDRFEAGLPGSARFFAAGAVDDKRMFDLPGFVLSRLAEVPKDRPILVHCRSGARSARACSLLAKHGHEVTNLAGGFLAWEREKLTQER
jgi:YfiH family protein